MKMAIEKLLAWASQLKTRYESTTWLVGILIAVGVAVWTIVIQPSFEKTVTEKYLALENKLADMKKEQSENSADLRSKIDAARTQESSDLTDLRGYTAVKLAKLHNTDTAIISILKSKITDEVDSTYYFERVYNVDRSKDQPPLRQFFYATSTDRVTLSIWQERGLSKISVSVNGGTPIEITSAMIKDQKKQRWEDVDISKIIQLTPLTNPLMPDLPPNVNLISITPRPITEKPGEKFEIHALVIVKRGIIP